MRVVPGARLEVEQTDARHLLAVLPDVAVARQLIAAAHGQHRGAARHRGVQRVAVALQVLRHEQLVAVLAAAHEVEVGGLGVESPRRCAAVAPPARGRAIRAAGG